MAQTSRVGTRRRSLVALMLLMVVLLGPGACSGAGDDDRDASATSTLPTDQHGIDSPSPTEGEVPVSPAPSGSVVPPRPTPSQTVSPSEPGSFLTFQRDCERGAGRWRPGQVDYPDRLSVQLGRGTTYNAAVDVRDEPLPADDVVENPGSSTSELVAVQCVLGARLVAVDEGIEVAPSPEGEWSYREFTPSGVVEWAWSVTAATPQEHQLRLDLRPAVRMAGLPSVFDTQVSSFTTEVDVGATRLEGASFWFSTQWPLLVGICAVLAAAVLAVAAFGRRLLGEARFNRMFGRLASRLGPRRPKSADSPPDPPTDDAS